MRTLRILKLLCLGLLLASTIPALAEPTAGPRLGQYDILSYGSPGRPPIRLGHFELLSGGQYRFYDNGGGALGQGAYSFAGVSVQWLSGPFKNDGWDGGFEVSRQGKTHSIKLKRGTFGSNSTDSK